MSSATKCDGCGAFYKSEFGDVFIECISVGRGDGEGTCDTWDDIDLCPKCARELLKVLKPALQDLDPKLGV